MNYKVTKDKNTIIGRRDEDEDPICTISVDHFNNEIWYELGVDLGFLWQAGWFSKEEILAIRDTINKALKCRKDGI